jgi:phosphoserine phosphatase
MKYKLVCFDMDGVIFDINIWMELHKVWGTLEEGKVLTKKYLKTDSNGLSMR